MVPNGIPVPLPCSELASRKPSRPAVKGDRTNRPDIWLQAIRSKLCAGSCKQGSVHIWAPAFAGEAVLSEVLHRRVNRVNDSELSEACGYDRRNASEESGLFASVLALNCRDDFSSSSAINGMGCALRMAALPLDGGGLGGGAGTAAKTVEKKNVRSQEAGSFH